MDAAVTRFSASVPERAVDVQRRAESCVIDGDATHHDLRRRSVGRPRKRLTRVQVYARRRSRVDAFLVDGAMLAGRRIGLSLMIGRIALALYTMSFIGCGDNDGPGGPSVPLPDAGPDTRIDASHVADSGDERETGADATNEVDADGAARPDVRLDSGGDLLVDSQMDSDDPAIDGASIVDSRADIPEAILPDGGPVTGPGCGGCFADELQAGGRCFTNTSCGSPPNAVMRRINGVCQIESCHAGWGDCDGRPDTGCETDFTRPETCNGCKNACPLGQFCGTSGCITACAPPMTDCGGACVDLSTSPLHCKVCFEPCTDKQWHRPTCTAGVCGHQIVCGAGSVVCGSVCSLLDEDPAHCGSCGRTCSSPAGGTVSCRSGVCIPHCPAGFTLCGGACVDQQTDPVHCGTCGNTCATGSCVAGACDSSWSPIVATGMAPSALALDDASLYWVETQAGRVMKVAKTGGTPVALATAQADAFDLALDASSVYWSSRLGNAIRRIAKVGGTPPELVAATREPMHIATDGTFVFFEEPPPRMDAGSPGDAAPPADAGLPAPPVVRKTRIGSGVAEDFFQFPNGDTDATLTRMLVDDRYMYWAARKRTAPGVSFAFFVEKETGNTMRALPAIWGEIAMDDAFIYITTGSGNTGTPLTVGAVTKADGRGWGIMQFDPGAAYPGGGSMAVGNTYLYRSSPGALTGVQKVLKCGTQNMPSKINGTDQWSSLVADAAYVYGVFGNEIRRAPR